MTFIYALDPYSLDIYCMCENELPHPLFWKLSSNGQTDRHTHTTEIIYHAASRVAKDVTSVHSLTTGSLHCLWPPLPFFSSFHHTVTHINRFCGELQQTQNRTTVPVDYFCTFTCVLQNTKRTCWEYCRKLYIAEKKYSLDCIFVADSTCGSILNHFYLIDHRTHRCKKRFLRFLFLSRFLCFLTFFIFPTFSKIKNVENLRSVTLSFFVRNVTKLLRLNEFRLFNTAVSLYFP